MSHNNLSSYTDYPSSLNHHSNGYNGQSSTNNNNSSYSGHHSSGYSTQLSHSRYHPYGNTPNNLNNLNNNLSMQYPTNNNNNLAGYHAINNMLNNGLIKKKLKKPKNEYGITMGQPGSSLKTPNWDKLMNVLPKFQKNFYRECESTKKLTKTEINEWRKKNNIEVLGNDIPKPIYTFNEAGFPPYILTEIKKCGFTKPTAIQSQGWPFALSGRNVIGIAETGSGKTLGFILPSIVHINAQPLLKKDDGPIVLIILPTRELAMQVEKEVYKFAYTSKIKHTCIYGGVSRREQINKLLGGIEILICTPGRLLDFLENNITNLFRVTYLVIDEADRLLDMGFEPQLTAIFSQVRPDRQILMWSATWPKTVRELSKKFLGKLNNTLQVICGNSFNSTDAKANKNVKQVIEIMTSYEKQDRLLKILYKYKNNYDDKILIFISTKKLCDNMYYVLKNNGINCSIIHGGKQQIERDYALNIFKNGKVNIMIATDIASRGIHINNIKLVINYDFPNNLEDYVHRIGRTGRCGNKGMAISFFTNNDAKKASKLIKVLETAKQYIPKELIMMAQNNKDNNNNKRY